MFADWPKADIGTIGQLDLDAGREVNFVSSSKVFSALAEELRPE